MAEKNVSDGVAARVIAQAWSDPEFKAQLLSDPAAVLQAEGIRVRDSVELRAVEDSDEIRHVVIPPRPANSAELNEDELEEVAAGIGMSGKGTYF